MAYYDHEAIYEAYKNEAAPVVSVCSNHGAIDTNGNMFEPDAARVAAARKFLDEEAAKIKYQVDRNGGTGIDKVGTYYPEISEQLDQLYHDINSGKFGSDAKTGKWFVGITSVKTANPKPS